MTMEKGEGPPTPELAKQEERESAFISLCPCVGPAVASSCCDELFLVVGGGVVSGENHPDDFFRACAWAEGSLRFRCVG